MTIRSYSQSGIRFLLIAGAMCVWSMTMAQMAHATCGDYLSHAGQVDSSDLILMFRPDQSPPKFPCSGPECQNHRPDPMPETPLIVITTIKPAYSVSSEMTFPPIPQCATRDSQSLLLTSACRQRIDRPPQTSGF